MPLRCLDQAGESIQAFDFSDDQWRTLQIENRRARHLRMPCCASKVTLKTSPRGTRFFAHKARGPCVTAPEKEEHRRLKLMVVEAARAHGWTAETEVVGMTPAGEPWKADVLARRGAHKVAVEIQWSGQTNDETLRRQRRYADSGVRGLWLLRQPGFPVSKALPAVCIGGSLEAGFLALIPTDRRMTLRDRLDPSAWHQSLAASEFLDAVFGRRFKFGVPANINAVVSIRIGQGRCWHDRCRKRTRIVMGVEVTFGPNRCGFSIAELGEHPELLQSILRRIPADRGIGAIKQRFSNTVGRSYVSNGCRHCGRLIGAHFEPGFCDREERPISFPINFIEIWRQAVECQSRHSVKWGVYPAD